MSIANFFHGIREFFRLIFLIPPKLDQKDCTPASKYDDFSVEYYPKTGVYYAKHKNKYLQRHWRTGVVCEMENDFLGITYGTTTKTENEAWEIVDLYIEQWHKYQVRTFRRLSFTDINPN